LLALVLGLTLSIGGPVSAKRPEKKPGVSTPKKGSRGSKRAKANTKAKAKVASKAIAKPNYHQVSRGDTLGEIAQEYGCSSKSIMRANKLKKDSVIRIGKKLKIPKKCSRPGGIKKRTAEGKAKVVVHTITSGETLGEIAKRYGTESAATSYGPVRNCRLCPQSSCVLARSSTTRFSRAIPSSLSLNSSG
jgi:LysM repeat protein